MRGDVMELQVAPVDRIIRNAGARRVSEQAAKALVRYLEDYAADVAARANAYAKHAGRKTVTAEDIRLAARA